MLIRTAIDGDNPTARYRSRVVADGGSISNYGDVQKIVQMLKTSGRFKNVKLLWYGGAGVKLRTSGVNSYVSKAYSVQLSANDLSQTTELSQPWQSGNIAPNEKPCLLNPNGGSRFLSHPTISFGASEAWSVSVMVNWNGEAGLQHSFVGKNSSSNISRMRFKSAGTNQYYIVNEAGDIGSIAVSTVGLIGKNAFLTYVAAGNGSFKIYLNGTEVTGTTVSIATNIVFSALLSWDSARPHSGNIHYYLIQSGALSASQVAAEYNTLRALIPERESVTIGSQAWTTSNLDIVCDAQGVVIPEVTDNAAWAALTTPAWCHFSNDPAKGAIYGKLYNWYAIKQIDDALAATGSEWRVPTQAQFNTLATALGGASVAGGKMKVAGTSYWTTPNTGADNSSGFSGIASGYRNETSGLFALIDLYYQAWAVDGGDVLTGKIYFLNKDDAQFLNSNLPKKRGASIRLVKTL